MNEGEKRIGREPLNWKYWVGIGLSTMALILLLGEGVGLQRACSYKRYTSFFGEGESEVRCVFLGSPFVVMSMDSSPTREPNVEFLFGGDNDPGTLDTKSLEIKLKNGRLVVEYSP